MQPTLVITSPAAGIVHINGRFAGETGPDNPIIMPITPNGSIYLQFFPFGRRYRSAAYRLSASAGNISKTDDTSYLISWPGSIYEISLMPLTAVPQESEFSMIDGIPAAILRGEASQAGVTDIVQKGGALRFTFRDFDFERISALYAKEPWKGRVKVEAGTAPAVAVKLMSKRRILEEARAFVRDYAALKG